ncbi:unnamed protein product [Choristocarpus tenellus]
MGTRLIPDLESAVQSCKLTTSSWNALRLTGLCACCCIRLTGCRDPVAFAYGEEVLLAHLEEHFAHNTSSETACSKKVEKGQSSSSTYASTLVDVAETCPLCLDLLKEKVVVSIAPPITAKQHDGTPATGEMPVEDVVDLSKKAVVNRPMAEETAVGEGVLGVDIPIADIDLLSSSGGLIKAISDCVGSRGYSLNQFGLTVSVPGCFKVRQVAFLEAYGNHLSNRNDVVDVKEAFKLLLVGALEVKLGVPHGGEHDFWIEITTKATLADQEAAEVLGGPPLKQVKHSQGAWGKNDRWEKRKRARAESKNPGLTSGMVKKALTNLTTSGEESLALWAKSWVSARGGVKNMGEDKAISMGRDDGDTAGTCKGEATKALEDSDILAVAMEGEISGEGKDMEEGVVGGTDKATGSRSCADTTSRLEAGSEAGIVEGGRGVSKATLLERVQCLVVLRRDPIYVQGRYMKLSRVVPQTPWMKGFYSVQEAIAEPIEAFSGCAEAILHGGGREDIDVRMLGKGRPFVLQLTDSRRSIEELVPLLAQLVEDANADTGRNAGGGVCVASGLSLAGAGTAQKLQGGLEARRKKYRCVVWVSRAITVGELEAMCRLPMEADVTTCAEDSMHKSGLVLQQATPIRVLHRRTLMTRPKSVYAMEGEWINAHFFVLTITTSGGTYIKEFVHGDLGRTVPSVGSLLGCRADILQLDVVDVLDKDDEL